MDASPIRSSVLFLPMALITAPMLVAVGVSVTITQRYRPQIWFAWVIYVSGAGALIVVHADTSVAMVVGAQILLAIGSGIIYGKKTLAHASFIGRFHIYVGSIYFPVLSPLPVEDNAYALSFLAFLRSFAGVCKVQYHTD